MYICMYSCLYTPAYRKIQHNKKNEFCMDHWAIAILIQFINIFTPLPYSPSGNCLAPWGSVRRENKQIVLTPYNMVCLERSS